MIRFYSFIIITPFWHPYRVKAVSGAWTSLVPVLLIIYLAAHLVLPTIALAQPTGQTFNTSGTYVAPAVYTAMVKLEAPGGGGGAYAGLDNLTLLAGSFPITIGVGGSAVNPATDGGSTFIQNPLGIIPLSANIGIRGEAGGTGGAALLVTGYSGEALPTCPGIVAQVSNTALGGDGVQGSWTVPSGGPYIIRITAKGGDGGQASGNGGGGATIIGDFTVNSGEVLEIIAGSSGGASGGGGGGSGARLLVNGSYQNLLIAGGGGGGNSADGGQAGNDGSSGKDKDGYLGGSGGTNGNGGQAGSASPSGIGGGGGGGLNTGGTSFIGGGSSGFGASGGSSGGGGFGAGGGSLLQEGSGGGGGYSGGGGGASIGLLHGGGTGGGGGGSLNTGTNQSNTAGVASPSTATNGYVTVNCLGPVSLPLVTSVSPNPVCAGSTVTLAVTASGAIAPYSYTWTAPAGITLSTTSTSAVSASVDAGLSGQQTLTVIVAASGGSPTSTSLVSVTVNNSIPTITSIQRLTANTTGCPYRLQGVATGSSFVFTGPGGYVFSNVYRNSGTYSIQGLDVKLPGIYTLTASVANSCSTSSISQTVTISASQCP